jgi:carboxymethylenebutenolidase
MRGYMARPAAGGKRPGVVVVHENRGLNPYIEDVVRRLAVGNYAAFAPDALTPVGGYPGDEDKARDLFAKLDDRKRMEDLLGAVPFLASRAAVPFYGRQPSATDTQKIKAPLLIHYAGEDQNVNAGWPAWKEALDKAGVKYREFTYPGTQHGFHNDTTPRYDEAAAKLAWSRTLAFFKENLEA